jgi:hypothetical protein
MKSFLKTELDDQAWSGAGRLFKPTVIKMEKKTEQYNFSHMLPISPQG